MTSRRCVARLVSGRVTFTTSGPGVVTASLTRGHRTYARGLSVSPGGGRSELMLTAERRLRPGRYTLTLRSRRGSRLRTHRTVIVVDG